MRGHTLGRARAIPANPGIHRGLRRHGAARARRLRRSCIDHARRARLTHRCNPPGSPVSWDHRPGPRPLSRFPAPPGPGPPWRRSGPVRCADTPPSSPRPGMRCDRKTTAGRSTVWLAHGHEAGRVALVTLPVMVRELRNHMDPLRSRATTGRADPTPASRVFVHAGMRGNASTARIVGPEVCP